MLSRTINTLWLAVAMLAVFVMGASSVFAATLPTLTQSELDTNWVGDRYFPTGGVTSVTAFGRDDVAQLSLDSTMTQVGTFQRTEGIKTVGSQNFGTAVEADLYVDSDWENKAVRAGLWVVGDNGSGGRDNWFGIIEFVNNEDHEGWRVWDSAIGWTPLGTSFTYGEWASLKIELDTANELYHFYINNVEVGTGAAGENFISEIFLNSYNYGEDTFVSLSNESYSAHWHAGLVDEVKPSLNISTPINGDIVSTSVTATGTASDVDSGLKEVTYTVTEIDGIGGDYVANVASGATIGLEDWSFEVVGLEDGYYRFKVKAEDNAGNTLTRYHDVEVDSDTDDDNVDDAVDKCLETSVEADDFEYFGQSTNRWMWNGDEWIVVEVKGKGKGPTFEVDMDYTYGCSGTQILDSMTETLGEDFGGHYKHGLSKSILEAWHAGEYNTGPAVLDTVFVSGETSDSTLSSLVAEDGVDYTLNTSGTYRFANWGDFGIADAEWALRNDGFTDAPLAVHGWTVGELTYPSIVGLDLLVDGNNVDWGDFSESHEYSSMYTGTGAPIEFSIYDSNHSDNEGGLTVEIVGDLIVSLW